MLSTRNLTAEDLAAMTTYLLGDSPPPPAPLPASRSGRGKRRRARHLRGAVRRLPRPRGKGVPNTVVALRGNSTLRLADPRNLIVATLDGIGAENFPHRASLQAMPGFADKLSDEQAAALVNYLRVTWGGQKPTSAPLPSGHCVRRADAMRGQMHHLDLTVSDLARSRLFYELVLGFLGYRCVKDSDDVIVWDLTLPDGVCGIAIRPAARVRASTTATRWACTTSRGTPTAGRMSTASMSGWPKPA